MITARSRWRGFLCIDALSEYQATAYESRSLTVWTAVPSHVSSSPWLLSHHCIMQASSSRRTRCNGSYKTPRTLHISSTTIMSIYTIRMTGTSRIIVTLYHNHSYYNKAPSNAGTCWTTRRTTSCWCTTWGPMMHGMAMEAPSCTRGRRWWIHSWCPAWRPPCSAWDSSIDGRTSYWQVLLRCFRIVWNNNSCIIHCFTIHGWIQITRASYRPRALRC